jgi:transcription antitermination factor NusG
MPNTSIEVPVANELALADIFSGDKKESYIQPRWYAAYTRANHEQRVADQFVGRGMENFLPQYESLRKWKDRRVRLKMPLFPGYVFVHLSLQNKSKVLQVPGVVCLVGFGGRPVAVPEEEFARIRGFSSQGLRAEPHPYLNVGRRVRVTNGPLQGLEGVLLRRKNKTRFVLSFELIMRSVAVEIDEIDLVPVG